MNNLFGRGKEPFWQQAYTNLMKFLILLNYDSVTLFDVYECAINDKLEFRIKEGDAPGMVGTAYKLRRWCALLCSRITYCGESRDQVRICYG